MKINTNTITLLTISSLLSLLTFPQAFATISAGNLGGSSTICDPSSSSYSNVFYLYGSSGGLTTVGLTSGACGGVMTAVTSGNEVNFTTLAFGSANNPRASFGVGVTGSNASITCVNSNGICFSITKPTTSTLINLYYYLPTVAKVPAQISLVIGSNLYTIPYTQYKSANTGTLPFVYLTSSYLEVEYDPSEGSSITVTYNSNQAAQCQNFSGISNNLSNSFLLTVILPLVVIAGAILFAFGSAGEEGSDGGGVMIGAVIVVIAVSLTIILGYAIFGNVSNVLQSTIPC
jgi:hypothetical protein